MAEGGQKNSVRIKVSSIIERWKPLNANARKFMVFLWLFVCATLHGALNI